jgi:hypothetical protein
MSRELDAVVVVGHDLPRSPADQAVARVPAGDLGDRQLQVAPAEAVAAVGDPVGPGHQHLATAPGRVLVDGVAGEQRTALVVELAQARPAFGDDGAVPARGDD